VISRSAALALAITALFKFATRLIENLARRIGRVPNAFHTATTACGENNAFIPAMKLGSCWNYAALCVRHLKTLSEVIGRRMVDKLRGGWPRSIRT
jgi:hypothetical protein